MMHRSTSRQPPLLPPPPARIFLVGIGGIGMSGLAQLLRAQGHAVAGSDRQFAGAGKDDLYAKLRLQGIELCPQDGRGLADWQPDAVVASAAVEAANPDLAAARSLGAPVLGRARCLADSLNRYPDACQIAVAGSCGKTSVTGWLASALQALGQAVTMVNGGLVNEFERDDMPGNVLFSPVPDMVVVEVDESDRSLTEFEPDIGVLLNIGTDHYDREELLRVFGRFLDRCREAVVAPIPVAGKLGKCGPSKRRLFGGLDDAPATDGGNGILPRDYLPTPDGIRFRTGAHGEVRTRQFGPHSAANGAAVLAALDLAVPAVSAAERARALEAFRGVRQRFEYMGRTATGLPVYNDYAHNVEKIGAAIRTAREVANGPLVVFFQPHGFGPLAFMRTPLAGELQRVLLPEDRFVMLPVFYAGGTAAFTPTSAEVAREYASLGLPVQAISDRQEGRKLLTTATPTPAAAVLILGARDPSLRTWSLNLAGKAARA